MKLSTYYDLMFNVGCNKFCSAWNKIIARLMNKNYPIWMERNRKYRGLNNSIRKTKIVASITSYPLRFPYLVKTIDSIMHQTVRPDRILLWLCNDECNVNILSKELLKMQDEGLEILFTDINLKPHNKYFHTASICKDSIIITFDDDILYDNRVIENLMNGYKLHPNCVICNMAHEICYTNSFPSDYDKWNGGAIGLQGPSHKLLALGVGGVLYPPNLFDEKYFNSENITKYCLHADDLWLKWNEVRLGIEVYKVNCNSKNPVTVSNSQDISLTDTNNGLGRNNEYINNLNQLFKLSWE